MRPAVQALCFIALSVGVSPPSLGEESAPLLPQDATDLLTAIDVGPSRPQLEAALPGATLERLVTIAIAAEGAIDIGARISAIRALGLYPSTDAVRTALKQLLVQHQPAEQGSSVLIVMAALETLGRLGQTDDALEIASLLTHPSRDVRVSVARALRTMGAVAAVDLLRARQRSETVPAVKLAISEAIQAIAQNP
jgi:hypothetical protein